MELGRHRHYRHSQIGYGTVLGSVVFTDTQHGWAVGGLSQVVHTDDGGAHWRRPAVSCGDHGCTCNATLALAFPDNQNGWLVGQGVFGTKDGGERWAWQDDGIAGEIQDIQFVDKKIGWLATDPRNCGIPATAADGGTRWTGTSPTRSGGAFYQRPTGVVCRRRGTILHYSADRLPIMDELFLPRLKK
ncbi:MAG: YCF48-related protein [Caldilineaceae bacterium]